MIQPDWQLEINAVQKNPPDEGRSHSRIAVIFVQSPKPNMRFPEYLIC